MHRDVEVVALPGRALLQERHEDPGQRHQRRAHVPAGIAGIAGRSSVEVDADHAGERLDGDVVRRLVAVAAGLPERRDRAVDELRRAGAHLRVADAEPVHDARPERLDEDVGALGEAHEDLAALGVLQVEPQAPLPAMGIAEVDGVAVLPRPDVANRLAAVVRLDLDHVRAVVGHHHREVRPGQEERELDDPDACELHVFVPSSRGSGHGSRHGSERELRAELDHAVGRQVEVLDRARAVALHPAEQLAAPGEQARAARRARSSTCRGRRSSRRARSGGRGARAARARASRPAPP